MTQRCLFGDECPAERELERLGRLAINKVNRSSPETGWLVEAKPSLHRTPHWMGYNGEIEELDWTPDSRKAMRFARQQDAETFIAHIGWTEAFASEHQWG